MQSNKSQQNQPSEGEWLTLVDYSHRTGVSLSTLRRYIKAEKIPYRLEQGKYLIRFDGTASALSPVTSPASPAPLARPSQMSGITPVLSQQALLQHQKRIQELEIALRFAREEIAELKMLVSLYEQTSSRTEGEGWSGGQA